MCVCGCVCVFIFKPLRGQKIPGDPGVFFSQWSPAIISWSLDDSQSHTAEEVCREV